MTAVLNYITWDVDPAIFEVFGREIRWYGLLFAMGFVLSYPIIQRIFRHEGIEERVFDKMVLYAIIATVVGARLGHIFFYDLDYYMSHPENMIKVWEGGLASHGGAIGLIIAMWIFSVRVSKKHILWGLDRLVIGTALTGGFIRLGNLFNSEIAGKITDSSLGWYFPRYVNPEGSQYENINQYGPTTDADLVASDQLDFDVVLRYPTQIYESIAYFLIFAFLLYLYWKKGAGKNLGLLFGWFLTLVFGVRVLVEFIKENQDNFDATAALNKGQVLSLPLVAAGLFFIWAGKKGLFKSKKSDQDNTPVDSEPESTT